MDVTSHFCLLSSMIPLNPNKRQLTSLNVFSKAIEKAADNPKVVETIGVPILRGPWYEASLSVGHQRRSVSCTFPVSGPHGSGSFQIEATRNGEDGLLSFLRHHDWEIITMEAHLHVPSDDGQQQTVMAKLAYMSTEMAQREEE
ncbi:hypothetical protein HU200_047878 [Digitaria exilis]|uniref:Uncharacterized protein n=1 Tax=Digitaria exilis TaxID=1010633 RepID=A0A835EDH3_9POAL|nr:hypothetical protein HU200_047878 [Digitaria exilis]